MESLDLRVICENSTTIPEIYLEGCLDAHAERLFMEKINEIVGKGHEKVQLNLSKLTKINKSGIKLLLWAKKRVQDRDGQLIITNSSQPIVATFRVSGFLNLLLN